jgi:Uncharacterized protein involved in cytokinesis, contains TGc (transglutaminase/protease-like) domain
MNRVLLTLFFIACSWQIKSQGFNDYADVERTIRAIPDSLSYSTTNIAAYINSHFTTEKKRVRAIYSWVTANIKYDKDSANAINLGIDPDAKITVALRRRRGVCENYAAIFNDICLKSGLTSFVVNGYTKQMGTVDRVGHSWCAIRVDGNWSLFDPTWDEGSGLDPKYFMTTPSEFIETHMPYDPIWQMLDYPVSHRQFSMGNIYTPGKQYFNYADSIEAYIQMDSLNRFKSSALRIQNDELYNSMVRNNNNYIKMNIEMINQDRDANQYNSAVADVNEATASFNNFVDYRNKQFIPQKTDEELREFLETIDKKLESSLEKLDQVDKSEATFTLGTEPVRTRIARLMERLKEQKDFVNRYTNTDKSNRQSLFYK